MPRKITTAIILLRNTLAKEHLLHILSKKSIKVLATPKTVSQALLILEQANPDLIICDDEFETTDILIPKLKQQARSINTVLILDETNAIDYLHYIPYGIIGFIKVSASINEFVEGITQVLNNQIYLCTFFKKITKSEQIKEYKDTPKLSAREKEIMANIALGLTNEQIGFKLKVSPNTVNNHRAKIRKKLKLEGGKSILLQRSIAQYIEN
jgi:two-component system, NarL family, response regulator NreC